MRGLLEKDFRILAKQKRLAIIYFFVAVMLSFTMDSSFIVSYVSLIGSLLAMSTLSYDAFDNGYPFLMSLPIESKTYVYSKYAFSGLGLLAFWAIGVILQFVSLTLQKTPFDLLDALSMDFAFLPFFLLIISLMLPISIKYGSDKGRIVLFIIFGFIMAVALLGKKILEFLVKDLKIDVATILEKLQSVPQAALIVIMYVISIALLLLSMAISVGIMNKKEY